LDIKARNKCFLAKQLWNIHLKFDFIWIRWVDHFYLPHNSLWSSERLHSSSALWKSLCSLKDQLVVQLGGVPKTIATLHDWYQGPSSFIANAHDSSILKVLLSAGTVLSRSSGLYLGTGLSFSLLFLVSSELVIASASSPLILFMSSVTEKMNPMLTYFSVVIGLLSYGVVLSTGFT
jgi:hypothetical protein